MAIKCPTCKCAYGSKTHRENKHICNQANRSQPETEKPEKVYLPHYNDVVVYANGKKMRVQ